MKSKKTIPVFHKTVKSNHLEILKKFDKLKDKPGNRAYKIDFYTNELPFTCAINEIGQLPRHLENIVKKYNKETAILIIQKRIIDKILNNKDDRYFQMSTTDNEKEQIGEYLNLALKFNSDGTCDFNYMITFTVVMKSPSNLLFRDAILGILPFRLISSGGNINSGNQLETYVLS